MSILISPTLANLNTPYYALASTVSGAGGGVSSFTNGGQIDCSSGTGNVTLTNTGVRSLTAAATANGLTLNANVGSIVVNYTSPVEQQPLTAFPTITSFPAVTLSAGQTEELYRWNYGVNTNVVQLTMGIINSNSPYFTYTRTTGVPNLVLWVGPLGLTSPPAGIRVGQYVSIVDEAVTGFMNIPQNLNFVATATNYQSGGTTDYWAIYATNGSSGDTAFTIPGSNYGTWTGSAIASLASV